MRKLGLSCRAIHSACTKLSDSGFGPVEIEPLSHDEDRKCGGIAAGFCRLAHDRLEAGGRLRIGIGRAPTLRDAKRFECSKEIGILRARHRPDEAAEAKSGLECVGGDQRCAEQDQEAVEEAMILDETPRHHWIWQRSREQFLDEAVPQVGNQHHA